MFAEYAAPVHAGAPRDRARTFLLRGRIGPGAGLFVGSAERVPLLERVPDLLGRRLGLRAQLGEIDAGNPIEPGSFGAYAGPKVLLFLKAWL